MISPAHVQLMARYNVWQNGSLYAAADTLSEAARRQDRGAFFGSVHATLTHILWADQLWLSRFAGTPKPSAADIPASKTMIEDWSALQAERARFDATLSSWAGNVSEDWLGDDVTWFSGATQREISKPAWVLVTHMFNHQTHHRGQVHCMLTQAGAKPDDTDIAFMPA